MQMESAVVELQPAGRECEVVGVRQSERAVKNQVVATRRRCGIPIGGAGPEIVAVVARPSYIRSKGARGQPDQDDHGQQEYVQLAQRKSVERHNLLGCIH